MKRKLYLTLILFTIFNCAYSDHLIGGKFSYRRLNTTSIEIKLEIERDCVQGNAAFENSVRVGIYGQSTNTLMQSINLPRTNVIKIPITEDCDGVNRCVELGIFVNVISLNFLFEDTLGYYMQWERCCMADLITNIINPGGTPLSPIIELPPGTFNDELGTNYTSPATSIVFNPTACLNKPFLYKFNYTDPDGDSIAYRFITPNSGGYSSLSNPSANTGPKPYDMVTYSPGYDEVNFISSLDTPKLNPRTGELTFTPTQIGLYLIGYAVDEFRNGLLIGSVYHHTYIKTDQCINVITEQPQDQYATLNSDVIFNVKHQNPNVTYQWQVNENNLGFKNLIGETSDSLILTNIDTSLLLNKYRCAIDKGSCIDYSFEVGIRLLGTGILNNKKQYLIIWPNPSSDYISIDGANIKNVGVYSLEGKLLINTAQTTYIDISSFENGIYLVKAEDQAGRTYFAKMLKGEK